MMFLVAYDIADPKRLQRVARRMERGALRVQKSVFIFQGTESGLLQLLDRVATVIDVKVDVLQAWRLAPGELPTGTARGAVFHPHPHGLVLDTQVRRVCRSVSLENTSP